MAAVLSESTFFEESPEIVELRNLIQVRLGDQHPLAKVIGKGIAFHHAGLPSDILSAIEEQIRQGNIQVVIATTSLTDGVNLPVRTVFVDSPSSIR